MTVGTNDLREEYTATAGQTVFSFDFRVFADTDLNVYQTASGSAFNDSTDLITAYSVSRNANQDLSPGGSITLNTGATLNDRITIVSAIPETRTTDYQDGGVFDPDIVDDDFDRVVSIAKQASAKASRAMLSPESEQNAGDLPLPDSSTRATKALGFDSNGDPTVSATTLDQIDATVLAVGAAGASPVTTRKFKIEYADGASSFGITGTDLEAFFGVTLQAGDVVTFNYFNAADKTPQSGAEARVKGTTGTAGTISDGLYRDSTGRELELISQNTPERWGAVGDGVADGSGIFSGTDDTGALTNWLQAGRNYYTDTSKVYMSGNLSFPDYDGKASYLHSDITIAFAGAANTAYGLTDYEYLNNTTDVMRGARGSGVWRLYGNDHVTNGYIGRMFDARVKFAPSRCLGAGVVFTTLGIDGTTKISGTAVDNQIECTPRDNGAQGFQVIDSDRNKITDGTVHIPIAEGNGDHDFDIEPGAGWQITVDRNYGSSGGGRIRLGSAATRVHYGQNDSGNSSPSGATGRGFYVDDVQTSNNFDQASSFVQLSGQINYSVSCGGLSSGTGVRGIDANLVTLATENGYFELPNTTNSAVMFLVNNCLLSYIAHTSIFGTTDCPLRFENSATLARYVVTDTISKVSGFQGIITETVQDGGGAPKLTISTGEITVFGSGHYRVIPEGGGGTVDDLDTINGVLAGNNISLSLGIGTAGTQVTCKDGTGNLRLSGDFTLDNGEDTILMKKVNPAGNLLELSRANNA